MVVMSGVVLEYFNTPLGFLRYYTKGNSYKCDYLNVVAFDAMTRNPTGRHDVPNKVILTSLCVSLIFLHFYWSISVAGELCHYPVSMRH